MIGRRATLLALWRLPFDNAQTKAKRVTVVHFVTVGKGWISDECVAGVLQGKPELSHDPVVRRRDLDRGQSVCRVLWHGGGDWLAKELVPRHKGDFHVYLSSVTAPSSAPVERVLGAAAVLPGSGRPFQSFRMYLEDAALQSSCGSYADSCRLSAVRDAVVNTGDYSAQFCAFGLSFPSGDALLELDAITKDQFPCQGVRLTENGIVATNDGKACCQARFLSAQMTVAAERVFYKALRSVNEQKRQIKSAI